MQLGGKGAPTLARDTVFCVIMMVCDGVVGLLHAVRYREQGFGIEGAWPI